MNLVHVQAALNKMVKDADSFATTDFPQRYRLLRKQVELLSNLVYTELELQSKNKEQK